jgi:hypothetical protein
MIRMINISYATVAATAAAVRVQTENPKYGRPSIEGSGTG